MGAEDHLLLQVERATPDAQLLQVLAVVRVVRPERARDQQPDRHIADDLRHNAQRKLDLLASRDSDGEQEDQLLIPQAKIGGQPAAGGGEPQDRGRVHAIGNDRDLLRREAQRGAELLLPMARHRDVGDMRERRAQQIPGAGRRGAPAGIEGSSRPDRDTKRPTGGPFLASPAHAGRP